MAFGERVNDTVEWIQLKISKHDQAAWEQQAEKFKPEDFTTTRTKLKKELIDVDLIRGTQFEKPKPSYNWTDITFFGILRLVFLPLYWKWWTGKTSRAIFSGLALLWCLLLLMSVLVINLENVDDVLLCECLTPIVLWFVVGLIFCQAVATDMKKAKKSGISTLIKKSKTVTSSSSTKQSMASGIQKQPTAKQTKSFTKKIDTSVNLRRRVVLRNSNSAELKHKTTTKSTTSTSSTISSSNPNSHDLNCEWSEHDVEVLKNGTTNNHHTLLNGGPLGKKVPVKAKDSDESESEVDIQNGDAPHHRHRHESSTESEHETDSSEHNGILTESMWTESETDSRTPLYKARKPGFSTILENTDHGKDNAESSSDAGSDGDEDDNNEEGGRKEEKEHPRAHTPSGDKMEGGGTHRDSISDQNPRAERIRVKLWLNEELVKVEMSPLEIGYQIISKVENMKASLEYLWLGVFLSFIMSVLPFIFRAHNSDKHSGFSKQAVLVSVDELLREPLELQLIHFIGFVLTMSLSICFITLFVVAERAYSQRYLYAKYFNALTTMRRAKQHGLPHFRLRSIQNIKAWLSLRSVLRRVGPLRSVGIIITSSFLIMLTILTVVCIQFFSKGTTSMNMYFTWEAMAWSMCLGMYLLRLFTLGNDIQERFDSQSLLITEQINLYFFMQQSPQKKEQLVHANQVLQLSSKLLKEIDNRENNNFVLSPLVSQFLRVFLLSAFSGLASEFLGFKLKLWKMIK